MDLSHIGDRAQQGEMADLRAALLETLIQLVPAGSGTDHHKTACTRDR